MSTKIKPDTLQVQDHKHQGSLLNKIASIRTAVTILLGAVLVFATVLAAVWSVIFFTSVSGVTNSMRNALIMRAYREVSLRFTTITEFLDNYSVMLEKTHYDFFSNVTETIRTARDVLVMTRRFDPVLSSILLYHTPSDQYFSVVFQPQLGNKYQENHYIHKSANVTLTKMIQYIWDNDTFAAPSAVITTSNKPRNFLGVANAFKAENLHKKFIWSVPHIFAAGLIISPQIVLTRQLLEIGSSTVYGNNQGVLYTVIKPLLLGSFLEELITESTPSGIAYVVDIPTGFLLAVSDPLTPTYIPNPTGGYRFVQAKESNTSLVQESFKHLESMFDGVGNMTDRTQTQYYTTSQGVVYFDAIRYTQDNLDLAIIFLVRQNDLIGTHITVFIVATTVSAVAIVIAMIGGCTCSSIMLKPLRTLQENMKKISNLELEGSPTGGASTRSLASNMFTEVRALNEQFSVMKKALTSFGKYVPTDVVRLLLSKGNEAIVGFQEIHVALFFSDIVSFTSLLEQLPSEKLVLMVEKYFSVTSQVILENEGTIDKYIGDAIFAFWNAPKRVEAYIYKCVLTAIKFQKELRLLESYWQELEIPFIHTRIGIHAGNCLVGNMGSDYRLNYTAIGDSVNLAARLEGLNKYYASSIMVSEPVYQATRHQILYRPLDKVTVVGKKLPTMIYEAIDEIGYVPEETVALMKLYETAFELYLARKFFEASYNLRQFLYKKPSDVAALSLLERCEKYMKEAPSEEWDGTNIKTEK